MLLDGSHGIERTFEVVQKVWAEVFFHLAENNVMFEGILLSPLALNAQRKPHRNRLPNSLTQVMMIDALACTLEQFVSGGRSENTCLKPWGGRPEKEKAAQDALLVRVKAESLAQRRK
ncbi:unnamed protein product [Musa acuminata subsp. burmannicoides]